MANQNHLDILKQGVEAWNSWRNNDVNVRPDLTESSLAGTDLSRINLSRVNLSLADLTRANLSEANLRAARLYSTHLYEADLRGADLRRANFYRADLRKAYIGYTIFGDVNLSVAHGLKAMNHEAPSTVGIDTIIRSHGKIPVIFLHGAGVPQPIIEQIPALIRLLNPIDYYSCFISYSSKDDAFAQRLYADLQAAGVRCWFAPEDMKIGDRIRSRIDESIHNYDKLLLVLSEHSVSSKWVEFEVEAAMDKEQEEKPTVLFPVRLDNTVLESTTAWAAHIKRTRNIGDFTQWKNPDAYQKAFNRLLRDLKAAP